MYLDKTTNIIHWCCTHAKQAYPRTVDFEAGLNSFCIYELCNGANGQFNHYIHPIRYCPFCGAECKPRRTRLVSKPPGEPDWNELQKQGKVKIVR